MLCHFATRQLNKLQEFYRLNRPSMSELVAVPEYVTTRRT
jgi:hypothetical protein